MGLQWKLMDLSGTPNPTVPEKKESAWPGGALSSKSTLSEECLSPYGPKVLPLAVCRVRRLMLYGEARPVMRTMWSPFRLMDSRFTLSSRMVCRPPCIRESEEAYVTLKAHTKP